MMSKDSSSLLLFWLLKHYHATRTLRCQEDYTTQLSPPLFVLPYQSKATSNTIDEYNIFLLLFLSKSDGWFFKVWYWTGNNLQWNAPFYRPIREGVFQVAVLTFFKYVLIILLDNVCNKEFLL